MSAGDVTVIVPVWNRRDLLERLLRGLCSQTLAPSEVLVIDDGSEDDSADLAVSMGARAVRTGVHRGFAAAVNRGIRESRTPLLAIVNNDVELAPDWLERISAALDPAAWFATGRILQAGDRTRIDATFDALGRGAAPCRIGYGCLDGPPFQRPREIWCAPFTAALFRAALFDQLGLLDERFESYLEDVDFGLRCALAGFSGRYAPDALAWHAGSATLGRWHPATTRLIARNQVWLVAKHYHAQPLWPIFVAQALWGLVAIRHGRAGSWLRGKLDGLRQFRDIRAPASAPSPRLAEILREADLEIYRAQRACGTRNLYWNLYFLFTGGPPK